MDAYPERGRDASRKLRGHVVSASYFEWAFVKKNPDLPSGGPHFPYAEDG